MLGVTTETAENLVEDIQTGKVQRMLESLIPKFWSFLWCVILAIIVYFVGNKLIKVILKYVKKGMDRQSVDDGVETFICSVLKYFLYILLFVVILSLFGVTTTSISAAIAGLGVTAGFALNGTLSNFAGGILILITKPFKVGDYIKEDTHNNEGTVEAITIVYTTLVSIDGKRIMLPNGMLSNSSLTNYTTTNRRMLNETVGISYKSDVKKAKEIIKYIIENVEAKIPDEDIKVFVASLDDSAVKIGYRFWTPVDEYWATKWTITEEIKERFDKSGIEICYNQLDVHIDNK